MTRSSKTNLIAYACVSAVLFFVLFVYTPLPARIDRHRDSFVQQVTEVAVDHIPQGVTSNNHYKTLQTAGSTYAFVTFLAGGGDNGDDNGDDSDGYFVAARILTYQLLHAPRTRSKTAVPLLILVTSHVSERKRARLQRDGAIIIPVDPPTGPDVRPAIAAWNDVMAKLHIWKLTQFKLVAFLDADTVLTRPLDGVFEDPAATLQKTLTAKAKADEGPLPETYTFAGTPEVKQDHSSPPGINPANQKQDYPNPNYLNAGFFVTKPSSQVYHHYMSLVNLTDRYNTDLPEQNLLNYAHRRKEDGGNMPWTTLSPQWNVHYPRQEDADAGIASLHEKWWVPVPGLAEMFISLRWKMEGYHEAKEQGL